jgi:hypothetical protein
MNRIKTFEGFVNEMEIGRHLFADPAEVTRHSGFKPKDLESFLRRAGIGIEGNTPDEKSFLDALVKWTGSTDNVIPLKDMQILLGLKGRFPAVLDPAYGGSKIAYRATRIDVSRLAKLNYSQKGGDFIVKSPGIVESTGRRGYSSFSTRKEIAEEFARRQYYEMEEIIGSQKIPVILTVAASDHRLLFNADFTNMFTEYSGGESEVFMVAPKYAPLSIIIHRPKILKNAFYGNEWDVFTKNDDARTLFMKLNLL